MLIRHSMIYAVAKIVPGVLGMATTALLTRLLDPRAYGFYGLALVVMSFGSTMAFDWLGLSFLRFYQARRDDARVIGTFVRIFLLLVAGSALVAAALWLLGLLDGFDARICAIGVVMMWAYAWFELVSRFEIADFQPARYLAMNFGRGVLSLAGAAGAAWLTRDPVWAAAGMALGMFAGARLCGPRAWRCAFSGYDAQLARAVFAFGLPMAASMTMSSLVGAGTRGMIAFLASPEALGFYTAGFLLIQNTLVVIGAGIASAGYSLAVRAVEAGDAAAARRQLADNATLLLAVLAPAALGMALTAHDLATLLVGPRYVTAVTQLTPWLAFGTFFATFRGNYLDHAFQLGKRPSLQVWVTGLAAVIAIGLCFVLVPRYGQVGAAMATAAGMVAASVLAVALARHAYPIPLPAGPALRIAGASLAMAVVVLAVSGSGPAAFAMRVAAGAASYLAVALACNVLGARTRLARAAWPWRPRRAGLL